MLTRSIGSLTVSALGMGAMTLTQTPEQDPADAVQVLEAALDAGITLFDTADSYGPTSEMGVNELALVKALRNIPGALDRAIIATKGGHTRGPNATWWIDGTPEYLASAARGSAKRLGLDAIPLYHHHRPDPRTSYAESMGAMRKLVDDGVIARAGISNVGLSQYDIAKRELGDALVSVQNEFSPMHPADPELLARCEADGVAFLAWGPLGGMRQAKHLTPHLQGFQEIAAERGVSPQRIALAWLLEASPVVIPIPGASRPQSVEDSAEAVSVQLTQEELARLQEAL